MLSENYKVLKTQGRETNKEDITALINKELDKSHDFFICEVSAFKTGEVKKICNIIKPKSLLKFELSFFKNLSR